MSEQLALVNLEIRAGTARDEALRNLARAHRACRTSAPWWHADPDRPVRHLGGQALRVHAETMRTKRRQRAEEAAAKTTIKLVFPLVFFIFPAMFVVILGRRRSRSSGPSASSNAAVAGGKHPAQS